MKVPWKQARMVVEPRTLEVMKEWRGEDNTSELEDIFKEIIVIDDDDDDEGDCGSSSDDDDIDEERESSLEVVSYQAGPQELQEREPERYRWGDHPSARVPGQTYVLAPRPRHAGPRRALGPSARAPQEYSRHPAESYQPSPLHQQPPPTIRSNVGQTSLRDGGARSLNAQIHYRPTYRPEPHYVAATALRSAPTPHSPQMATQPGSFRQDPTEGPALRLRFDEPPRRTAPAEKEPFEYFRPKPPTQVPLRPPPQMVASAHYAGHPSGALVSRERHRTPEIHDAETVVPSIEPLGSPISSRTRQQREIIQAPARPSYYTSQRLAHVATSNGFNNPRDIHVDIGGAVRPAPAKRKSWPIQYIVEDPPVKRQRPDSQYEAIANCDPRRFHVTSSELPTIDLTSSPQQLRRREDVNMEYPYFVDGASSPRRPQAATIPRPVKQSYVNELGRDPATGAYGYYLRPLGPERRNIVQPMPTYSPYAPAPGPPASAAAGSRIADSSRNMDPPHAPHVHPPRRHQHSRRVSADDRSFTASRRRPAPTHPDGYVQPVRYMM
ncbi:hypothetical protein LTS18_004629 [Coniosporium uncinatum]|uniref:Uncharacterized protein n=1 Tax=Coniosporium uncinatum TaxID=93489 RepID=A0ACC3DS00_9PEZI|nr:hypothetical protein LTS18_004629 [Coniosporium uncinatum]